MRSYQVFAGMTPERTGSLMAVLADKAPMIYASAIHLASAALKSRPAYLQRQPQEKRAAAIRRALSRIASNDVAEEVLAVYFLECRKELLIEWLDLLGVAHEEGILSEATPSTPDGATLRKAAKRFLGPEDDGDRALLLEAFAAQGSIDWPDLEALLPPRE